MNGGFPKEGDESSMILRLPATGNRPKKGTKQMKRLKKTNEVELRRVIFPYVLKKQKNGSYLPLNRRYKPLGFVTYETVKYEMFPIML